MDSPWRIKMVPRVAIGVMTLVFFCACICACRGQQEEIRKAAGDLLSAAYEKNTEKLRQYADFDKILDGYLKEQKMEGNIDVNQRQAIIDELVVSTCELSKDDYDQALKTLRVETDKNNSGYGTAIYSTSKKKDIVLGLEKRKTGWIVIKIF